MLHIAKTNWSINHEKQHSRLHAARQKGQVPIRTCVRLDGIPAQKRGYARPDVGPTRYFLRGKWAVVELCCHRNW